MSNERALKNSRVARHLVRRLARDCDLYYPGGATNAALVSQPHQRLWEIVPIDGRWAPRVFGTAPLKHLLRDGFLAVISDDRTRVRLYATDIDENLLLANESAPSTSSQEDSSHVD